MTQYTQMIPMADGCHTSLITTCPYCGDKYIVNVSNKGLQAYLDGGLVQECFPDLDTYQRELIITGICPICWDKIDSQWMDDCYDDEEVNLDDDDPFEEDEEDLECEDLEDVLDACLYWLEDR